ncbi:MAG: helix-hairpin-helix domain-containing protein [Terriglobales bacterium]|jgi:DNA uptake protein ComE-like DNA-binding protein|nr:helix-hairpin-helix domain-containing protein [Terriglobales bacterium]
MNRHSSHGTQLYDVCKHLSGVKILVGVAALLFLLAGCGQKPQNPDELREKTADATAQLKTDTKAVVEGVREGLSRDKPINLNTATQEQLEALPGVTHIRAGRVIAARPYDDPHDVVTRHILSEQEYKRIADRVTTK